MSDAGLLRVVGAAIVRDRRCLVGLRRGKLVGWEFPGGKIEPGESPTAAVVREVREELGVEAEVLRQLATTRREVVGRGIDIELTLFSMRILQGEPQQLDHDALRWVDAAELAALELLPADRDFLAVVSELLATGDSLPAAAQ